MLEQTLKRTVFSATSRLTKSSQKFMASWQSPQLHTDRHLNGQEREILFFFSCLELDEHLVELEKKEAKKRNESWEQSTFLKQDDKLYLRYE